MLLAPEVLETYQAEMVKALEEGRPEDAARHGVNLSSSRCARILGEAPREMIAPCLRAMKPDRAGRVLGALPPELAASALEDIEIPDAAALLTLAPDDHAADIIEAMDEDRSRELLEALDESKRNSIRSLTRYPHGSCGAVMIPHYLAIPAGATVGETLNAIQSAPREVERASYVYIVNGKNKPIGVISLKDVLRFDPKSPVEKAMNPDVVVVHTLDRATEAARIIRNRRFTVLPVINESDGLVGIITFEDAMDILAQQVADQIAHVGAAATEESFFTPPLGAVRRRLPWMGANVFLNLGAVLVISSFEDTIAQVAILAAFLPMITDMGGNVGIQALSVSIRSLALGEVRMRDFWKATRKELIIGLINGVALGALFAVVATVLQGNPWIGLLAGVALGVNVLLAGVVGGVMPYLIKRIGKDPAMMTGPILTTITDITGVTIYLGLCTIFLSNLLVGG
ncbi:MAG: magnesium transporter [Phycisphaeraceae bacterium]|nr:MAG: magnesium transporter [Phycisphaeraceae bacterium]